jgi:hypothetical protein
MSTTLTKVEAPHVPTPQHYNEVARRAGLCEPRSELAVLLDILKTQECKAHDLKETTIDLEIQAKTVEARTRATQTWYWAGLTPGDRCLSSDMSDLSISPDRPLYRKPVPICVLHAVCALRKAFPEIRIMISELAAPDPYAMLLMPSGNRLVFAHWAEPSYGNEGIL